MKARETVDIERPSAPGVVGFGDGVAKIGHFIGLSGW